MGWNVYRFGEKSHHPDRDAEAFYEAARMAKEGVATMMELAREMESRYGERYYGMRERDWEEDRYGRRDPEWDDYHERRRRDSRGRYM